MGNESLKYEDGIMRLHMFRDAYSRDVTTEDLIAALKDKGAVVMETVNSLVFWRPLADGEIIERVNDVITVIGPGRYLLLKLEDE